MNRKLGILGIAAALSAAACFQRPDNSGATNNKPTPSAAAAPGNGVVLPNGMPGAPAGPGAPTYAPVAKVGGPTVVATDDRFFLTGLGSTFGLGTPSFSWSATGAVSLCDPATSTASATVFCASGSAGTGVVTLTVSNGAGSATATHNVTVDGKAVITASRGGSGAFAGGQIDVDARSIDVQFDGSYSPPPALTGDAVLVIDGNYDSTSGISEHDICAKALGHPMNTNFACNNTLIPARIKAIHINTSIAESYSVNANLFVNESTGLRVEQLRVLVPLTNPTAVTLTGRVVVTESIDASGAVNLTATQALYTKGLAATGGVIADIATDTAPDPDVPVSAPGILFINGNVFTKNTDGASVTIENNANSSNFSSALTVVGGGVSAAANNPGTVTISSDDAPLFLPRAREFQVTGQQSADGNSNSGNGGTVTVRVDSFAHLQNVVFSAVSGTVNNTSNGNGESGDGGEIELLGSGARYVLGAPGSTVTYLNVRPANTNAGSPAGGSITIGGNGGNSLQSFVLLGGRIDARGSDNHDTLLPPSAADVGGPGGDVTIYAEFIDINGVIDTSGGDGMVDRAQANVISQASEPGKVYLETRSNAETATVRVKGNIFARTGRGGTVAGNPSKSDKIEIQLRSQGTGRLEVDGALNTAGGFTSGGAAVSAAADVDAGANVGAPGMNVYVNVDIANGKAEVLLKDVITRGGDGNGGGHGGDFVFETNSVDDLDLAVSGALTAVGGAANKVGNGGNGGNVDLGSGTNDRVTLSIPSGINTSGGNQTSTTLTAGGNGGTAGYQRLDFAQASHLTARVGNLVGNGGSRASLNSSAGAGGAGNSVTLSFAGGDAERLDVQVGDVTANGGSVGAAAGNPAAQQGAGGAAGGSASFTFGGSNSGFATVKVGNVSKKGGNAAVFGADRAAQGGAGASASVTISSGYQVSNDSKFEFGDFDFSGGASAANANGIVGGAASTGGVTVTIPELFRAAFQIGGINTSGSNAVGSAPGNPATPGGSAGAITFSVASTASSITTGALRAVAGSPLNGGAAVGAKISQTVASFGVVTIQCGAAGSAQVGPNPNTNDICIDANFSCASNANPNSMTNGVCQE